MTVVTAEMPVVGADSPGEATRQRILDAAERLFSEHGLNGVSLRSIVARAGVNTAAIHYHFGSKEGLLEAVFARRAVPIAEERLALLADCREVAGRPPLLEQIIAAFLNPGLRGHHGGMIFARMRARLAADASQEVRGILSRYFDDSSGQFLRALGDALPELPLRDLHWRFHTLLGTMVYTMANPGRIQVLSDGACDPSDVETTIDYLVPFMAQMLRAPSIPAEDITGAPRPTLSTTKQD